MKVLVGCEFSGKVREAFKRLGHDAWSCDLLDTEIEGNHYKGNILDILYSGWDLAIFHPPCTYITNAGVRHLHSVPSKNGVITKIHGAARWKLMEEACEFFNLLKNCPIKHIMIENPVPHRYARALIGKYNQIIQPYQFGEYNENESKKTCLWLKNLPLLKPTIVLPPPHYAACHMTPPSTDRWKKRSVTYKGIADQIAKQYSQYILNKNQ